MMIKSYRELRFLTTFEERFEYLKLGGVVGNSTFGFDRYVNQGLYHSNEWRHTRRRVLLRDGGCDLGISNRDIHGRLLVHHIMPITLEDIESGADCIFDPDNLITTTIDTHNAIHYGDVSLLPRLPVARTKNDTCLWA